MSISRPLPPSFSPSSKSRSSRSGNVSTSTSISISASPLSSSRRRQSSHGGGGGGGDVGVGDRDGEEMEEDDVTKRLRITEKTVEDLASQLHLISQSRNYPTTSSPPQSQSQSQSELESTYQENTQLTRCCCEIQSLKSGEIIEFGKCQARDRIISLERDLGVCALIGQALLERYEALSRKCEVGVEELEEQSTLLAQSYTQCANLERANDTHLKRYTELSRKNEGLERRLLQMNHTQNLTSSTLLTLRTELTHLRQTNTSLSSTNLSILEHERREHDLKEQNSELVVRVGLVEAALGEAERLGRDERLRREKVEKEGLGRLVGTAREKLGCLVSQIQDLNQTDAPDVQRTLETLVADNVLAHHTSTELTSMLTSTKEQVRILQDENDELRTTLGVAPRTPLPTEPDGVYDEDENEVRNVSLIARSSGTGSATSNPRKQRPLSMQLGNAQTTHGRKYSWTPSIAASIASSGRNSIMLSKRDSLAPSFGSSIGDGTLSPRASMLQPLAPAVVLKEPGTSTHEGIGGDARTSPIMTTGGSFVSPRQRNSVGLGYTINGLPKVSSNRPGALKQGKRSFSADRPMTRVFASGVDSITEWVHAEDEHSSTFDREIPRSPASLVEGARHDAFHRKRMSLTPNMSYAGPRSPQLQRLQTDPLPSSPIRYEQTMESPRSEVGERVSSPATEKRRTARRQLMLLQSSKAVQTDPLPTEGPLQLRRMISRSTDPGLGALGFENASSSNTTPQQHFAFSPQPTTTMDMSETSSLHDARSTSLPQLVDHMTKLLGKIRQADVPTLTRRLKKQHLPGDVGHLSQSTMKALALEVDALRAHFKVILDQEREKKGDKRSEDINDSAITRRDFTLLLRLFKEVFSVLVDLQATVNRVIIDPSSAKKLREVAQAAGDEEDGSRGRLQSSKLAPSGLGWIAAPLAKYFATVAVDESTDTRDSGKPSTDRSRLQPPTAKAAPKQSASTLATTTHVNVEFGGSGMVKRATSTLPTGGHASEPLPPSPADTLTKGAPIAALKSTPAISLGDGTIRGRPARREDLFGIFAGAPAGTHGGWRVVSNPIPDAQHRRLRTTTSQYFGTLRQPGSHKRQLSTAVDAVIDQPLPEHQMEGDVPERTLRPRALSDSSIRTTFVSHESVGIEPEPLVPAALQRSGSQTRSVMSTLGRRFQALTGVSVGVGASALASVPTVVESVEEEVGEPDVPDTAVDSSSIPPPTAPKPISSSSVRASGFLSLFAHGTYVDSSGMSRSLMDEYPDGDGFGSSLGGPGSRILSGQTPRAPVV